MPVSLQGEKFILSQEEVELLWKKVREETGTGDDEVTVKCIGDDEIKELNKKYRGKDMATNVLTFSYGDGKHDIALCLGVAKREMEQSDVGLSDHVAWLLVHAFLHVAGMDHERSSKEDRKMRITETKILEASGFTRAE